MASVGYILTELEEREREEIFRLKRVKQKKLKKTAEYKKGGTTITPESNVKHKKATCSCCLSKFDIQEHPNELSLCPDCAEQIKYVEVPTDNVEATNKNIEVSNITLKEKELPSIPSQISESEETKRLKALLSHLDEIMLELANQPRCVIAQASAEKFIESCNKFKDTVETFASDPSQVCLPECRQEEIIKAIISTEPIEVELPKPCLGECNKDQDIESNVNAASLIARSTKSSLRDAKSEPSEIKIIEQKKKPDRKKSVTLATGELKNKYSQKDEELGCFEIKTEEIVRINKFKNQDGTLSEEKQVITIKTERKTPHRPETLEIEPISDSENKHVCNLKPAVSLKSSKSGSSTSGESLTSKQSCPLCSKSDIKPKKKKTSRVKDNYTSTKENKETCCDNFISQNYVAKRSQSSDPVWKDALTSTTGLETTTRSSRTSGRRSSRKPSETSQAPKCILITKSVCPECGGVTVVKPICSICGQEESQRLLVSKPICPKYGHDVIKSISSTSVLSQKSSNTSLCQICSLKSEVKSMCPSCGVAKPPKSSRDTSIKENLSKVKFCPLCDKTYEEFNDSKKRKKSKHSFIDGKLGKSKTNTSDKDIPCLICLDSDSRSLFTDSQSKSGKCPQCGRKTLNKDNHIEPDEEVSYIMYDKKSKTGEISDTEELIKKSDEDVDKAKVACAYCGKTDEMSEEKTKCSICKTPISRSYCPSCNKTKKNDKNPCARYQKSPNDTSKSSIKCKSCLGNNVQASPKPKSAISNVSPNLSLHEKRGHFGSDYSQSSGPSCSNTYTQTAVQNDGSGSTFEKVCSSCKEGFNFEFNERHKVSCTTKSESSCPSCGILKASTVDYSEFLSSGSIIVSPCPSCRKIAARSKSSCKTCRDKAIREQSSAQTSTSSHNKRCASAVSSKSHSCSDDKPASDSRFVCKNCKESKIKQHAHEPDSFSPEKESSEVSLCNQCKAKERESDSKCSCCILKSQKAGLKKSSYKQVGSDCCPVCKRQKLQEESLCSICRVLDNVCSNSQRKYYFDPFFSYSDTNKSDYCWSNIDVGTNPCTESYSSCTFNNKGSLNDCSSTQTYKSCPRLSAGYQETQRKKYTGMSKPPRGKIIYVEKKDTSVNTKAADRYDVRPVKMMPSTSSKPLCCCKSVPSRMCGCSSAPNCSRERKILLPVRSRSFSIRRLPCYGTYFM